MGDDIKAFVLKLVESRRGDDLKRARRAWSMLSEKEMNEQYGDSGMTRKEILQGYIEHENRIDKAIAWVKSK